ncbi:sialidase family protein [Nocardioides ferulae]|uniref:sialidase family protein n=1 Tax=Nocardioides ferulae TaxID=2340821 RepID=UPI000EB4E62C|nr:sialidase family protein [Nocardioides ferulae]
MRPAALLVALTLLAGGCSATDPDEGSDESAATSEPTASEPVAEPTATPTTEPARPTPADVIADPRTVLVGVEVARDGDGYRVTSLWRPQGQDRPVVLVNGDQGGPDRERFVTPREAWALLGHPLDRGWRRQCAASPGADLCLRSSARPARVVVTDDDGRTFERADLTLPRGLLSQPVTSLARDTLAIVSGGDGATLFPFQQVSRSTDGGATWTTSPLPLFDGERAYTAGQVVLPDGRLLALLTHFSDDRAGSPSGRPHGLYVSEGADWSRFRPLGQQPGPAPAAGEWSPLDALGAAVHPRPVVWMQLGSDRLLVTDGGLGFEELPLR